MREEIVQFVHECPEAKSQVFANNPFGTFVRSEIPEALYETGLVDREKYLITASVGAGNWAMIPWICIFDRSITTSATKGVYIVYLLSKDSRNVDLLGNKSLLEKKVNIRASDYRFSDKVQYYNGYVNRRGQWKDGTKVAELLKLAETKKDYVETDILERNEKIINAFLGYLRENGLEQQE